MHPRLLPHSLILAALLPFSGTLRAETKLVSIRVDQNIKSEMGKLVPYTRTQHRAPFVYVSSNSTATLDLKVKYVVFGRDMVEHKVVVIGQGEQAVTVKASATEKVELPTATATAVEGHYDAKLKKMVAPSGATIIGQGVQVLEGSVILAESYDPPSLKEEWGKAAPLALPTAPAAAPAKPAATPAKPAATPAKAAAK